MFFVQNQCMVSCIYRIWFPNANDDFVCVLYIYIYILIIKYGMHLPHLKLLLSDQSTVTVFSIICFGHVMQWDHEPTCHSGKWSREKKNTVFIFDPHLGPLPNIRINQMDTSEDQEQPNPLTALHNYGGLGALSPWCLAMCLAQNWCLFML